MKRIKLDYGGGRRFKLSHLLLGIGILYLFFIAFKVPHFLEIAAMLSGDDNYIGLHEKLLGDNRDSDLSKPFFSSVYKDTFHQKLEDNENLDAPLMPREVLWKNENGGSRPIKPLQFQYGRITGEIMRRRNRTIGFSVLERMADEAWTLGLKAWEEVDKFDVKETVSTDVYEGKPESCPPWVSVSGEELASGDRLMFLPCGLAAGSSITVVGTPHSAHQEFLPQLTRRRIGDSLVMVSQFMVELQGLKSVDGEDPPKIFHLNPRLKGDWSHRPVIEHNTCYRMQWATAQRCDGLSSKKDDDILVDGNVRSEKWMRNDVVDSKDSKTISWFKRFIGREQKPEVTWPFPFAEDLLFILTLCAGVEGYHINVVVGMRLHSLIGRDLYLRMQRV